MARKKTKKKTTQRKTTRKATAKKVTRRSTSGSRGHWAANAKAEMELLKAQAVESERLYAEAAAERGRTSRILGAVMMLAREGVNVGPLDF